MTFGTTQIHRAARSIQERCKASGLSKAALARGAKLHSNSLRAVYSPEWDPCLSTMDRLEQFLNTTGAASTAPAPPNER